MFNFVYLICFIIVKIIVVVVFLKFWHRHHQAKNDLNSRLDNDLDDYNKNVFYY
jgi:hypothetical protein